MGKYFTQKAGKGKKATKPPVFRNWGLASRLDNPKSKGKQKQR